MRATRFLFLVLVLGLGAALAAAADRAQERRLQEAIHLMETKGDYPAAIKAFEELGKGSERAVAARALLYLGLCYEKLGKAEAQKAYERLLREFADQSDVVPQARERLAALERAGGAAKGTETVVRRVWENALDLQGTPSPDGKYLSYEDPETGDLAIRELATGKNRRLTNRGTWIGSRSEYADSPIWSPDSEQIAYRWHTLDRKSELRLIRLDGSAPRVLYAKEEVTYLTPGDWSPDGKQILARFGRKDGTNQIVLVSVADSSVRALKSLENWRYPGRMRFSPDGRYLVYDFRPKQDSPRDIFLLATDGIREICLVEHPADDFVLGWAPDGKRVLFASDRRGSVDAWAIPVADGKPAGAPELVRLDLGHGFQPLGFTRSGSFYYGMSGGDNQNIFLAELDPQTGKVLAPPKSIRDQFAGNNFDPAWSRDGRYLSFLGRSIRGMVLRIHSLETGEHREFPIERKLSSLWAPCWSPDGRSIIGMGYSQKNQMGLVKIDTQTGEVAHLMLLTGVAGPRPFGVLSPDGKAFYYRRRELKKGSSIHVRELETGVDREFYAGPVFGLEFSPDGQHVALVAADPSKGSTSLSIMPTAGGKPREILSLKEPEIIKNVFANVPKLAWTLDGRYLLFFKRVRGNPELWRIRAEGGQPEKLLEMPDEVLMIMNFCVHPDGRRIAFEGIADKQKAEVWVMENFLPPVPKEANSEVPR
jgi:Tol biopolymer transport system component